MRIPQTTSDQKKFVLLLFLAGVIYWLSGPLGLIATTSVVVIKKIADNKQLDKLIKQAIAAEETASLVLLEKKRVQLTNQQKLTMLVNASKNKHKYFIEWLEKQEVKINFTFIFTIFSGNQDIAQLSILINKFLTKNPRPLQTNLQAMLSYLSASKEFALIDSLFIVYPQDVLAEIFSLLTVRPENSTPLLEFIYKKETWLIENIVSVNRVLPVQIDGRLLDFLMAIFPNGQLEITASIHFLINNKIHNELLYSNLLTYFNKKEKNEELSRELESLITVALSAGRVDITQRILSDNPHFLATRTAFSGPLLLIYSWHWDIAELLIHYGADVNFTSANGTTLLESGIGSKYTLVKEKQKFLNFYVQHNVDLHRKVKDTPPHVSNMTLLGFLPFLNLRIAGNKDLDALRLQKFIALFLEIPGTSSSNGTACAHTHMQDSQACWNFLADLYFNRLAHTSLMANSPLAIDKFHSCIKALYSEEGDYDATTVYKNYTQGEPIVLPVHIQERWGGSHIATIGFIKIGPRSQLIVEADRGLGRHDFSVFLDSNCNEYDLSAYAKTRHSPIFVDEWQNHHAKSILRKNLSAQQSSFCPGISAKFAFHIAFFLRVIHKQLADLRLPPSPSELQDNIVIPSYSIATIWFNQFCQCVQELMLDDYRALAPQFIDRNFLALVEQKKSAGLAKDLQTCQTTNEQNTTTSFGVPH